MDQNTLTVINAALGVGTGLADNIIFAAAFHHHTFNGNDFDESLEHTLECLMKTKERIPAFLKEYREARSD